MNILTESAASGKQVKNLRGPAAVTGIETATAIAEHCEKARDQKVRKPEDLLPAFNFTFAGGVGG